MLKRRISNVMTYFAHRVTNAVSEGLNSKIQTIKHMVPRHPRRSLKRQIFQPTHFRQHTTFHRADDFPDTAPSSSTDIRRLASRSPPG